MSFHKHDIDVNVYPDSHPVRPHGETIVTERKTVRTEQPARQPDFLRDDYGKTTSGALIVRREVSVEPAHRRHLHPVHHHHHHRRRSVRTVTTRAPTKGVVVVKRETGPLYPDVERGRVETKAIIVRSSGSRDRSRSSRRSHSHEHRLDDWHHHPPPQVPIIRPPILQEMITHHRHIDHGIELAPRPVTLPAPPPTNVTVVRRHVHAHAHAHVHATMTRASVSRCDPVDPDIAREAEYHNRRIQERSHAGEACDGATRDWGLVDVPPGTEKVLMKGAGGGAQEISWDQYKGERRGKFIADGHVYVDAYGNAHGGAVRVRSRSVGVVAATTTRSTHDRVIEGTARGRSKDRVWTEISKDLVTREAVEESGYKYEETDDCFLIMMYLHYEDVYILVVRTEEIRRARLY
ncbi:hypothetical protein LTR81_008017 [Elasticomyces elasticus]